MFHIKKNSTIRLVNIKKDIDEKKITGEKKKAAAILITLYKMRICTELNENLEEILTTNETTIIFLPHCPLLYC